MQAVKSPAHANELFDPGNILRRETRQCIAQGLMPFVWRFTCLPVSANPIQFLYELPENSECSGLRAAWITGANQRTAPHIPIEMDVRIEIDRGIFVPHRVREIKALQTLREGMPFVGR